MSPSHTKIHDSHAEACKEHLLSSTFTAVCLLIHSILAERTPWLTHTLNPKVRENSLALTQVGIAFSLHSLNDEELGK